MVWLLYIIVGFFAALAGMARASYMSLGDPLSGDGMELDCIIAVLLGGTAFSGGEGSVTKTMVGALIIICVTTGLMTVIPAYWQNVAKGSVLNRRCCSQPPAGAGKDGVAPRSSYHLTHLTASNENPVCVQGCADTTAKN